MELTLDQALQKGIEAHKAGQVQEADRYYTAILKTQPKHPDANHNMGVLAVGVGKVEEALPFFKTALETNSSIAQYWLSYINSLIKLDQMADAKAAFKEAKSNGANGDMFDKLELRLNEKNKVYLSDDTLTETLKKNQISTLNIAIQLRETGEFDEAINLLEGEVNRSLEDANILAALSHCHLLADQLEEAKLYLDKAKEIAPDNAAVGWNAARLTLKEQKLLEALNFARDTSQRFPDDVEGMGVLGACLRANGEIVEGFNVLNRAIELNPEYAEALINRGLIRLTQGDKFGALCDFELAHKIKPHIKQIWDLVIGLKMEAQQYSDAIALLIKMIEITPEDEKRLVSLAICYHHLKDFDLAIEAYNKALAIKPDHAEIYNNMGISLNEQGKLEDAIEAYNKAVSLKPDYAEPYYNMGNALQEQTMREEAIEAYTKALAIKPDFAAAHRNLSSIKEYTTADEQFLQVQEYYDQEDIKDDDKCHLSFALAKMYEDIGKLDQAFRHLSEGNTLRKKLLKYSINQDQELFTALKKTQPQLIKTSLKIKESFTEAIPIFILGMARSGTTLVEQIISSHSEVHGAGELDYVSKFSFKITNEPAAINTAALSDFRNKYLYELLKLSDGKQFITDKMPQNFRFIPLICAAFPEAKIIHLQRDAIATCWSNFKQYFASKDLGYCYDLSDVVEYYELYRDLMKLWQSHYGDRIYNLNYERLTTNQETETRKLIEYLELNWEKACMSPHKNKRRVKTASQQQVRQKVYKGSSEAWRKYEPFLNGAFDSLPF